MRRWFVGELMCLIQEEEKGYLRETLVAGFVDYPNAWVDSCCSFYERGSHPRVSLLNLNGD